ncbi:MAG: sigma 54-interacting transcriptional regulator [Thermodesulfobacteriota bacterium]|nr:sigma 54-interacting transcriptional regulator [Thermodesulfobacteriota bacterium]
MEMETYNGISFFNIILDSIADGVFTINDQDEITSFNRAAEKITGFSKEEAIGQYCFNIFRANICQTHCALKQTLKTGKPIINLPVNILNQQGKEVPVSISTSVLKNEKGEVIGAVETFRDLSVVEELKKEISKQYSLEDIISKNYKIQELFNIIPDIAESDSTVLIQGPSGSGKELFARAIHNLSLRSNNPYVKVNCGAIPDTLLESELFGYVKGAFTDAKKDKPGRFFLAERGTIFLDEIGDMSPNLQIKLLRILQEKEYEPLGGTTPIKANVRVVTATNKNLSELVTKGSFREDLFYRINVVKIELPPLAERREDIPLLIENFIHKFNILKDKNIPGVSDEVLELLMRYDFPGNIRELENIIEHAFVLCKDKIIEKKHLPFDIIQNLSAIESSHGPLQIRPLKIAEVELIQKTLSKYSGNRIATSRELKISRSTLWRKIRKYGL